MFESMDDMTVEIKKIDNLKLVHIYELTGFDPSQSDRGCNAMAVFYGDDGRINMNEKEKHYSDLVQKVSEVYKNTNNKDSILMDDKTKEILENGIVPYHEECISKYYSMENQEIPVSIPASSLGRRFLSLVEYILVGIYKTMDMEIDIINRHYGWNGACTISGRINGDKEFFSYIKVCMNADKRYTAYATNFFTADGELIIDIITEYDHMELFYHSNDDQLSGHSMIRFADNGCKELHEFVYNGKQIYWGEGSVMEACESFNEELLIPGKTVKCAYKTPWKITYVLYDDIPENEVTHAYKYAYIYDEANYADIWCKTESINYDSNVRIVVDSIRANRQKFKDGRIQTNFKNGGINSTGEYRNYLQDKYFIE